MPATPRETTDFVLPVPHIARERREPIDIYGATSDGIRRPAVVLVHGGPVAPDADPRPRDKVSFVAYASLLAERGLVAVMFDHRMFDADHAPLAADDLDAAVDAARAHEGVDPDRVALWFFSMSGVLAASWLRNPPGWLRAVAWNYPILAPGADWDGDTPRFDCVRAVAASPTLPKLLLRVEHELSDEFLGPTQDAFVAAARDCDADLEVLDVAGAHHPFEQQDHTEHTRHAVRAALAWVTGVLTRS